MKKIAILNGWISSEREVSLRSGANMWDWCLIAGHEVDIYDIPVSLDAFLADYQKYDLVIPVFHGMYGEDGQITAFLETLWCRYAYSDFTTHALCMDKYRTNLVIEKIGIKIPRTLFVAHGYIAESLISPLVCYPVIVKPNRGGSSVATSKVDSRNTLQQAQSLIEGDDILIQECIEWREFTVGVYRDESGHHVLPIMEACNASWLHGYEEKYESDGSNEIFSNLETGLQKDLEEQSIRICQFLGTKWVVRIDWRYDGRDIYFLEVNTIPGFTSASFIPKMWKKAGKSEKEFIEMLS